MSNLNNTKPSVRLSLRHLGPVPAKKNSKMLTKGKLITKPEYQVWIKKAEDSLLSQLGSIIPTAGDGTHLEQWRLSWIASSMPADDCWTVIPEQHVRSGLCAKGTEGAEILIERL